MLAALLLMFAPGPAVVDHLVVTKSTHTLVLYSHGKALKTYNVAIGRIKGRKEFEGDYKTPEGHYVIDGHNAHSTAYKSLHISYPNVDDRTRAKAAHQAPGGNIMIHGLPNGTAPLRPLQHWVDWTFGCVALSDAEMDEVFRLVPDGTPIDIVP